MRAGPEEGRPVYVIHFRVSCPSMPLAVRVRIVSGCMLACLLMSTAHAQGETQSETQSETQAVQRMGAYQCLSCQAGGYLTGIRQGGGGRVIREFPPLRRLCVASYKNIEGEQYVFFQLESMSSRTDGAWTIRRERASRGVTASGERYAPVMLDDGGWPDGGAWGVKSNSWNAECREPVPR